MVGFVVLFVSWRHCFCYCVVVFGNLALYCVVVTGLLHFCLFLVLLLLFLVVISCCSCAIAVRFLCLLGSLGAILLLFNRDAVVMFESDSRWRALLTDLDRRLAFDEFIADLDRKEKVRLLAFYVFCLFVCLFVFLMFRFGLASHDLVLFGSIASFLFFSIYVAVVSFHVFTHTPRLIANKQ